MQSVNFKQFCIFAILYFCLHSKHDFCKEIFKWLFTYQRCQFPHMFQLFILSRAVVPLIQGFEDAGDFTVSERLKTSVHVNLIFYLIVGSIGLFGLILLILTHNKWLVLILLNLFYLFSFLVLRC